MLNRSQFTQAMYPAVNAIVQCSQTQVSLSNARNIPTTYTSKSPPHTHLPIPIQFKVYPHAITAALMPYALFAHPQLKQIALLITKHCMFTTLYASLSIRPRPVTPKLLISPSPTHLPLSVLNCFNRKTLEIGIAR